MVNSTANESATGAIIGFDFGSANIRVAKARLDGGVAAFEPQTVEFDGRRQLANRVLFLADPTAPAIVGDNVLDADMSDTTARPQWGVAVEEPGGGEIGRAAAALLAHVLAVLARDHAFAPDEARWRAVVAAPIAGRPGVDQQLEARLREAGFADAAAHNAALAALAHFAGPEAAGRYVVIDLGAAETRLALVEAAPGRPATVLASTATSPGGRDFDRVLFNHFAAPIEAATGQEGLGLETRVLIEQFKRDFSAAWAQGKTGHAAIYQAGYDPLPLSLDVAAFRDNSLAGPLVERFRQTAADFVDRHAPGGNLSGLILVGGGAHWPFVAEWAAQKVGPERVLTDQYPEEAVVRGLPQLAAPVAPSIKAPPPPDRAAPGVAARPPAPRRHRPAASPGGAFALELFGGLLGFLGLGWFIVLHHVVVGCLALLGWWVTLITLFALGVYSAAADQPALLAGLVGLWLAVPLTSAWLLSRRVSSERAGQKE